MLLFKTVKTGFFSVKTIDYGMKPVGNRS